MPIPKPKNKEKKSEFVSRCIGDTQMGKDFPDQKQRIAVCYSQWEKSKAEASVVAGEGENEFLYYQVDSSIDDEDGVEITNTAEAEEAKKKLNKPFRTPSGPKKFSVYVKNDKGSIVKVNFGDPNMEIKRDNLNRRKNFRPSGSDGPSDPYWSSVVLLLHCDGTNGSTTFTDSSSSNKTATANGNAQITTTNPKIITILPTIITLI